MSPVTLADIARAYHDAPDAPDAHDTWEALATVARARCGLHVRCPNDPGLTPSILGWIASEYEYYDRRIAIPVWAGSPPEYWGVADNCAFRAWHDRAHGLVYFTGACTDDTYTLASELVTLHRQRRDVRYADALTSALVTEIIAQYACYATSGTFPVQRRIHLPPSMVAAILAGEVTP